MFQWILSLFKKYKPGYYMCHAPGCTNLVYCTAKQIAESRRTNQGLVVVICPSHLEQVPAGRISDGAPKTNPDLEKTKV